MTSKFYIESDKLTTKSKSTAAAVLDEYYRRNTNEFELNEKRKRNMAFKIRNNSPPESASTLHANTLTTDARSYSNFTIDKDNDWWPNTTSRRKINYHDDRDDDYESMDDDYYVFNDDTSSCGSLGLYEYSNLARRLAQSERELKDQRAHLVANFRDSLGLEKPEKALTVQNEDDDDEYVDQNDPIVTLERLSEAEARKSLMKNIKLKSKDTFKEAVYLMPKTKYRQRKMLEKRILKSEIEGKFKEPQLDEADEDVWLADKLLRRFNPVSEEWKPIFSNGTGKTRMRLKHTLRQYSTSSTAV